jgi:glycosyltransferase involved in cell wall biosynthesis
MQQHVRGISLRSDTNRTPAKSDVVVLISAPSLDPTVNVSGISSLVLDLAQALRGKVAYEFIQLGAPTAGGWLRRRVASLACIARAIGRLSVSRTSLFHSNTSFDAVSICRDFLLILIAKLTGKRVLLHVHGGHYLHEQASGLIGNVLGGLLGMADGIVFLSRTELESFQTRYTASAQKMRALYNSVDVDGIESIQAGTQKGPLKVTFVGRFVDTKGLDLVLEAARAPYPNAVHFYIHGDGPGMALGVVPISTPIASIPEIVKDGERGVLVDCNDTGAVIAAISSLAADRSKLSKMRDACRRYALANYDVRINSAKLLEIYDDIARGFAA